MAYVVAITWIAKPGEAEAVAAAVEKLIAPTRAEEGVISYQPHRDPHDDHVFFFYEQYVDEAAFTAHVESEHAIRYGVDEARPRLSHREFAAYETWD
jgi:quinol monooxygenase YgiN